MPHRLVSLAILIFWVAAAASLVIRDVLPDLIVGPPPDLRDITRADDSAGPTHWTILVDDQKATGEENLRSVGQAITETTRQADGDVRFSSMVRFDSEELLKGTPFEATGGETLEVISVLAVDSLGNLEQFRSGVRIAGHLSELLVLEGRLESNAIQVRAQGPLMPWPWTRRFPYEARGLVQNALNPLERMPGLRIGQRWESRVVSPLTGRVETVRAEVTDRKMIHWDKGPVTTFEVATRMSGMSARTWVRSSDGLVLRQEVPLFLVNLVLERDPDGSAVMEPWDLNVGELPR